LCGPAAAAARQGLAATARVTCPILNIWAASLPESHFRGIAQAGIVGAAASDGGSAHTVTGQGPGAGWRITWIK